MEHLGIALLRAACFTRLTIPVGRLFVVLDSMGIDVDYNRVKSNLPIQHSPTCTFVST
jgi:hypothetical protein